MSEPVSIIASAVIFTGATIPVADAVSSLIRQLRNAPDEIAFLQNDVIDTQLILSNINDKSDEDRFFDVRLAFSDISSIYGNPEYIFKVEYSIKRIERVLIKIDSALRHVTKSRGLGRTTVHMDPSSADMTIEGCPSVESSRRQEAWILRLSMIVALFSVKMYADESDSISIRRWNSLKKGMKDVRRLLKTKGRDQRSCLTA